jgi:hypothetical protein
MASIFFVALSLPTVGWQMSDITGRADFMADSGSEPRPPTESTRIVSERHDASRRYTYLDYTRAYFRSLLRNFLAAYRQWHIVKWSLWFALATCGFLQIGNYIQNLWSVIQTDSELYNGYTELANNIVSTVLVLCVQFLTVDWAVLGEFALGLMTCIQALLLFLMTKTASIWIAYAFYVAYSSLYQLMITITTYNLAKQLETQSYGLVIGCNMFIALVGQTILTTVVTENVGLALPIRPQFLVYGGYHLVVAVLFLVMGCYTIFRVCRRDGRIHVVEPVSGMGDADK